MRKKTNVYIKGVPGRGKDVIRQLERLGGNNIHCKLGEFSNLYYYIDFVGHIDCVESISEFTKNHYSEIFIKPSGLKITELKIGDIVENKKTKFPMRVTGILEDGTIYLDFDGNEGDIWEMNVKDVELVKKNYDGN